MRVCLPLSPLERLKIDDWNRTIDVNIKGVLYGNAGALPHMATELPDSVTEPDVAERVRQFHQAGAGCETLARRYGDCVHDSRRHC